MAFNRIGETSKRTFKEFMRARASYFSKPFIYMLIVSTIIIFVSLAYGASRGNQVEFEVANQTLTEVVTMASELTWVSIFINNASMALMTFIPLFGAVWMIFVQYNTGWYVGAIAKAYDVDYLMVTSTMLTSIVGLIEYAAYIIALGESLFLVYSAIQGKFKERLVQNSWISIIIVVLLLFLGGVIEALMLGRL